MARSLVAITLLFALCAGSGCGDKQARIGLRNSVAAAEYIQTASSDPGVRAAAAAIVGQAGAAADQMDLVLWGLWESRSRATIVKADWEESPQAASRRSEQQTRAIQAETDAMRAVSGSLLDSLGLAGGLTGTGVLGLALAAVLKYRKELLAAKDDLMTSVGYSKEVEQANTDDEVEAIKNRYRPVAGKHLKEALAKRKAAGKLS